jgi:Leucine-rich repeat (LRR) protein
VVLEKSNRRETLNLTAFDHIRILKKLSIIGIDLNELIFPDCGLRSLEKFELVSNKLATFDLVKLNCSRPLEKLILSQNELTEFGMGVSCFMHDLEVLDLSYNKISQFNPAILSCASGLKKLYLNDNMLDSFGPINADGFCSTPRLKEMNLADNMLKSVNMQQFSCARKLAIVDLRNNQLVTLDLGVNKATFPRLNYFFLTNNTWQCDELAKIAGNQTDGLIAFATPEIGNTVCKEQEVNGICCSGQSESEEVKIMDILMPAEA